MSGTIRFAPSPTGYLHEGHLLSALFVWAAAKKWNLRVHLRIEDHDQGRARKEYIDSIREDLAWLGFTYDSESIQSDRSEIYQRVLQHLAERGLVYPCYCSRKQLLAENPRSETGEVIYQGKCRPKCSTESGIEKPGGSPPSFHSIEDDIRAGFHSVEDDSLENHSIFRIPDSELPHSLRVVVSDKVIEWCDERLGTFYENPKKQCGDFPIRDRDGYWTYQFAVCVDDLAQGITHIIRGEDILNSTARQIALTEMIADACQGDATLHFPPYQRPKYLHHPLIVDSTGKKLSKREHAHSLRQDKEAGTTPEQLFGRLLFKVGIAQSDTPTPLDAALGQIIRIL
jgi:glutamyl-tRNA synthetase/glutamyl-Q tRNA(Asp) synthetase